MNNTKKPFGLTIACSIAAKAIKNNIAPTSIILANLLSIQKSTDFPKNLEEHNFTFPKVIPSVDDKKLINVILNDLRGPHQGVEELLEKHIKDNWVKKIPDNKTLTKNNSQKGKPFVSKTGNASTAKNKSRKPHSKMTPQTVQQTVITVKKKKLI